MLASILAIYALFIIPTISRLGMGWDEATDLIIAQAYQTPRGVLLGLPWDLSQTRLPMFTVALVFRLFGYSSLILARMVTLLVGGLAILGIFILGKERFSPATGLLAAGLLAINPFFLSFARLAFTESDVYVACALTWLMVVLSRLELKPSLGWTVLSGLFLGLTIASKAIAVMLVPAACAAFVWSQMRPQEGSGQAKFVNLRPIPPIAVWLRSGWTVLVMKMGVLVSRPPAIGFHTWSLFFLSYVLVFLGWILALLWAVRYRHSTSHPIALAAFLAGFGLLSVVIFPPEHLGNTGIIRSLVSRADDEKALNLEFMLELASLHTFTILLKSTPVLGAGLLAGFGVSLAQWRRPELTTPLIMITAYTVTLLLLPLGQTFYTIPLLPLLSLLTAHQLLRLWSKRREITVAIITLGLIGWGVEMRESYPDYHLNGYQWLGARPIFGRSSIGYRSIVYVPLDGVEQSMSWLNTQAAPGQVVLIYGVPRYIIDTLTPEPAYVIVDGSANTLSSKPDYVVIHIGATIRQGEGSDSPQENIFEYPFDYGTLEDKYEKVFSVQRAFRLEMASVWKRR